MADEIVTHENVIAVGVADNSTAYEALTRLKELDGQGQVRVVDAAVVTRDDDGRVEVKDEVGGDPFVGTASGGIVGLLIGILGGPLGVLIGGASGILVGSLCTPLLAVRPGGARRRAGSHRPRSPRLDLVVTAFRDFAARAGRNRPARMDAPREGASVSPRPPRARAD